MEQAISSRSCDGCTACCYTHKIDALTKPLASWCTKCTPGVGCTIYGTHPLECAMYKCFWLITEFPEEWRPDRLGVVIDSWPGQAQIIRLWEVHPGTTSKPEVTAILEVLKKDQRVVIVRRLNPEGGYDDELLMPLDENDPRLKELIKQVEADSDAYQKSRA